MGHPEGLTGLPCAQSPLYRCVLHRLDLAASLHYDRSTAMKYIASTLSRDNLYLAVVLLVAGCTWGVMLYLAARAY